MTIHLFKRNRAQQWLGTMRKLDYTDMADTALNFDFDNSEYSVFMLPPISSVNPYLIQLFQLKSAYYLYRQGQLCCPGIHQCIAYNILSLLIIRKKSVLPVFQFHLYAEHPHIFPHLRILPDLEATSRQRKKILRINPSSVPAPRSARSRPSSR